MRALSVAWLEAQQDRVGAARARLSIVGRRLIARGLAAGAQPEIDRGLAILDRRDELYPTERRYGRAKARIGVYDEPVGWRDARPGERTHARMLVEEYGVRLVTS